jgi:peptide/nickel transport system permease protein
VRQYALRRALLLVPTLVGLSVVAFLLTNVAPGDPAVQYVIRATDAQPTPERVAAVRQELGLDQPLPVQYAHWLGRAATGDLGVSYATRKPVTAELARRVRPTAELAVPAALLALAVAVPAGTAAAVYRNRVPDQMLRAGAVVGASIPNFWLALLLIVLIAVPMPLFPAAGRDGIASAVLPVLVLATTPTAVLTRFTRSSVLEVLGEDYVRAARARGLSGQAVLRRHVVWSSLIAVITAFGINLGHLLTGTVIVESIFAWPGLGRLTYNAILERDFPLIQGVVLLAGVVFVVLNLLIDLAYAVLDPRVRLGARSEAG